MGEIVVRTREVSKVYSTGEQHVDALHKVSLEVGKGEFVAIMGASGSGKSTFMNIIGCLDVPTSGEYLLEGENVQGLSENAQAELRNKKIGFVFQGFNLLARTTAVENVELPLTYLNVKASERKERVKEILKRMNISHRASHFPQQLSGGQQQRVAIARAVISNPKMILADEPTGNLDSKNGEEVMNLLTELNREGTTIVMVTHNKHDATFAHRTINLFDGQIVESVGDFI